MIFFKVTSTFFLKEKKQKESQKKLMKELVF